MERVKRSDRQTTLPAALPCSSPTLLPVGHGPALALSLKGTKPKGISGTTICGTTSPSETKKATNWPFHLTHSAMNVNDKLPNEQSRPNLIFGAPPNQNSHPCFDTPSRCNGPEDSKTREIEHLISQQAQMDLCDPRMVLWRASFVSILKTMCEGPS